MYWVSHLDWLTQVKPLSPCAVIVSHGLALPDLIHPDAAGGGGGRGRRRGGKYSMVRSKLETGKEQTVCKRGEEGKK